MEEAAARLQPFGLAKPQVRAFRPLLTSGSFLCAQVG